MKGAILNKGFRFYTDMKAITQPIFVDFMGFNWFITDCQCNRHPDPRIPMDADYIWISGEEFLLLVDEHDIQFSWAVFSGIPKHISLEEVLKYTKPYADGYAGFWQNPIGIQHPLAEVEIVPWDSGLVLVIAKDADLVARFRAHFPLSEDLEEYNIRGST